MLDIERSLTHKFPAFASTSPIIRKPTLSFLRKIMRESTINAFLQKNQSSNTVDFIDRLFEHLDITYSVSQRDKQNIPAQGRVVIVANHPIGSLDGLAILRLVKEVRTDVKIIANDLLNSVTPLSGSLLPLDNMTRTAYKNSYKSVLAALESDSAVIIFPAGEVSRATPRGIKDGPWQGGFLHFARKAQAPILPIHISAKNSLLFYGASMLFKPLGTALLANEMFNKRANDIRFRIGELIPASALSNRQLADKNLIRRLKKHVYKIGKGKASEFVTEKTIAHPEDVGVLAAEIKTATELGRTRDHNAIVLCNYYDHPHVLREIGRLRELTFRMVGEGTGAKRDLDNFDHRYDHLVLWDERNLCIAGAYRVGRPTPEHEQGFGLYTAELFDYQDAITPYLEQTLELGRSFVHPNYWGKASLDYLWQGLGAYLSNHDNIRYLIGPVSLSAQYPKELRNELTLFYRRYYASRSPLALGKHPLNISPGTLEKFESDYKGLTQRDAFEKLQRSFFYHKVKFPVLFKQYAALFDDDGFQLLDFSIDSDFGDCIDGLFIADLTLMKPAKRERYLTRNKYQA